MKHHRAEFELGLDRGHVQIACSINRPYRERVEIHDERGRPLGTFAHGGLLSGILARVAPSRDGSLVREVEAFADAVRGFREEQLVTTLDGVAAMSVIEVVRRSALNGGIACAVARMDAADRAAL